QYLFRFHNYQIFLQRYGKRLPKPNSQKFLQHCCNTSEKAGNFALAMGRKLNLDIVGIGASLACAIHCAILPLFLNSLPLFGMNIIENQAFEYSMIALTFIIGGISLFHGYKKHHHSRMPFMIFSLGIIFLISKQIWHHWQYYFLPVAVLLIV